MSENGLRATDLLDALGFLPHRQDENENRLRNEKDLQRVRNIMFDRVAQDPQNKNLSLSMLTYFNVKDSKTPDPMKMHDPPGYKPFYRRVGC